MTECRSCLARVTELSESGFGKNPDVEVTRSQNSDNKLIMGPLVLVVNVQRDPFKTKHKNVTK